MKELPKKSVDVARTAFIIFGSHGLTINLKKGKTELLFSLFGPGSKIVWRQLAELLFAITFKVGDIELTLHFVDIYKHVGTM